MRASHATVAEPTAKPSTVSNLPPLETRRRVITRTGYDKRGEPA